MPFRLVFPTHPKIRSTSHNLQKIETQNTMKTTIQTLLTCALTAAIAAAGPDKPMDADADAADNQVIAVVLGQEITAKEERRLNSLILNALLQQFATENKIEPTEQELDAFVLNTEAQEKQQQAEMEVHSKRLAEILKNDALSDEEREQIGSSLHTIESNLKRMRQMNELNKEVKRASMRMVAQQFVKSWKINKALFEKYGGRVRFQQAGPEPIDAYRDFLKEMEKNGKFRIIDKQYEAGFWNDFADEKKHFLDENEAAKAFNAPWWLKGDA